MTVEFTNEERASQLRKPSGEGAAVIIEYMNKGNGRLYQSVLSELSASAGESILELGPGNGVAVAGIIAEGDVRYTGLDYSPDSVKLAIETNREAVDSGTATFIQGEVRNMPFEDASFDKILGVNIVYFFDTPSEEMKEIKRVLKPGGKIIFGYRPEHIMIHYPFSDFGFTKYSPEKLENLLTSSRFNNIRSVVHEEPDREIDGKVYKAGHAVTTALK